MDGFTYPWQLAIRGTTWTWRGGPYIHPDPNPAGDVINVWDYEAGKAIITTPAEFIQAVLDHLDIGPDDSMGPVSITMDLDPTDNKITTY